MLTIINLCTNQPLVQLAPAEELFKVRIPGEDGDLRWARVVAGATRLVMVTLRQPVCVDDPP